METLHKTGSDFTNSFRTLSKIPYPDSPDFQANYDQIRQHMIENSCTEQELKHSLMPKIDPRQLMMFRQLMQMNPGILEQMGVGSKRIMKEMEKIEKLAEIKASSY